MSFGVINQILTLAFGLFLPRLILLNYGSEVNGLLQTVNQVFVYFALLEAGVGTATLQALYKHVANKSRDIINGIMAATSHFYRRTGIIYLIAVLVFATIYPFIISTDIPYFTIFWIILVQGLVGALNYLLQGKYRFLLESEGKNYIILNLNSVVLIGTNFSKIVLILLGFDIVAVQTTYFVFNLIQIFFILIYMRRRYTWLDLKVKPDFAAISQKNSALVHQFSALIFNNTDVIILTLVLGLSTASVYSMYLLIFTIITTFLNTVASSVSYKLGQTLQTDMERYKKMFDCYETYFMALVFSLITVAYILLIPFLKLYTAGVTDADYINYNLPILFVLVNMLSMVRIPSNNTITFAGHFKKTQMRSIAETVINILVSLVCVFQFGIYGVLFGTIVALLYRTNDMIIYSNKHILNRSPLASYKRLIVNAVIFVAAVFAFNYIKIDAENYLYLILWAFALLAIFAAIYFIAASLANKQSFAMFKTAVKPFIKKFVKKSGN